MADPFFAVVAVIAHVGAVGVFGPEEDECRAFFEAGLLGQFLADLDPKVVEGVFHGKLEYICEALTPISCRDADSLDELPRLDIFAVFLCLFEDSLCVVHNAVVLLFFASWHVVDGEIPALAVGAFLRGAWGQATFFRAHEDAKAAVVRPFVVVGRIKLGEAPCLRGEVHLRVGFAYEGKLFSLWHGSVLLRLVGEPVLAVFKTGLARVDALVDCSPIGAKHHAVMVLQVHHDAVFLLFSHIISSLAIMRRVFRVGQLFPSPCSLRTSPIGRRP